MPGKSIHAVTMCRDFCRPFEITNAGRELADGRTEIRAHAQ